ncbi:MAG: hypothetical protein JXX14_17845, partial [Deltaproteobacteria bacterium]|nr:hypothetical protein [Deltaproteobacteria bacterium]
MHSAHNFGSLTHEAIPMLQYFQIPGQMQHIGRTFYRRMTPIAAGLLLTCLAAGTGCTPGGNPSPDTTSTPAMVGLLEGYALSSPDHIAHLPKKLREASDVTAVSQNQVAMVQDEKGIIFLFDLRTDKVVRKIKF